MPDDAKPGLMLCLTYHLPNISGLTLSAHEIVKRFGALGHPVRVVAARLPAGLPERSVVDGVGVIRVKPWFMFGKAPVMPGYGVALWRALDGIDVVNVHLPCLDAAVVAIVAKLRGRQLIVSHISSMSVATPGLRLLRAAAALSHVVAGWLADRIQVVSEDYAEASTFCRLFRRKLDPAPLPLSLPLFADEARAPRRPRRPSAERPLRIGYVGRIARQKSLDVLFKALPAIAAAVGPHVVIDLLGPSQDVIGETYWQTILAEATASGGAIRYAGVKRGRELADFYAELDLLVLPSTDRLESFGLVQVEAMLRGVPVLASDLPGMRVPVARTGMGLLFPAGDAAALAAGAIEILRHGPPQIADAQKLEAVFGLEAACAPYARMLAAAAIDRRRV